MSLLKAHLVYQNKDKEIKHGNYTSDSKQFQKELFDGDHDFSQSGGDVFKIALYTSSATLTSATTVISR